MFGTPETGADGWTGMGDDLNVPYLGYGHIVRYLSGGVESFVPVVYPKIRFQYPGEDASTQEDEIDWQTQELTADIFRADDANHNWQKLGTEVATEAEAETALKKYLGIATAGASETTAKGK